MSNRQTDLRISEMTGTTTLADTDLVTVVSGGTNKKMTVADFKAALGVTGTIVQDGAVTGTPVLDTQGTVNNIRSVEDGPGITASVSAENGLTLEHNFLQDTVGSPVLINPTAAQPTIASIEAGDGIGVVTIDGHIQISATVTPVSDKTIIVNELADFPTPVSGVITLLDDREYRLTSDVDLAANRLVLGNNCSVSGTDSVLITLSYSGTGAVFTMGDTLNRIHDMTISAPNGSIISRNDTSSYIFRFQDCTVASCDNLGTWTSVAGIGRFTNVSCLSITTTGLSFVGNFRSVLIEVASNTIEAGALYNLGTATFDSFLMDTSLTILNGSSNLIAGQTGSANINAGGIGLVRAALTSGTGTTLSGISVDDALWQFAHNDDIADTRPDALLAMPSNATNTVITVATTAVLVTGTWTVERTSQLTGTTAGRATYNGGKNAVVPVTVSATVQPASGTNKTVATYVALNGSVIADSKRTNIASSGSPTTITTPWQLDMAPGDYVEIFVANDTDTIDLLVSNAVLRVN